MRKVSVTVKPTVKYLSMYAPFLKFFQRISLVELLQVDFNQNIEVVVAKVEPKKGISPDDLKLPPSVEIFDALTKGPDEWICLAKINYPKSVAGLFRLMKVDGIWTTPSITTKDFVVRSFISNEENLEKFIVAMRRIGEIQKIIFKKPNFLEGKILSSLTNRQREILEAANAAGYYDEPRQIDGAELAKRFGCTRATMNEHLRRIENKIIKQLL